MPLSFSNYLSNSRPHGGDSTVKLWDLPARSSLGSNALEPSEPVNPNRKQYNLAQYDINWIPDDGTVIAYGKRRSGKTTISDLIYQSKREMYPLVLTMSQTAFNQHWQGSMPFHHVHQGYEPQLIKLLMRRCQAVETFNLVHPPEEWIDPRWALNLDDVIAYEKDSAADTNLLYDAELRKTFVMGRHFNGFCSVNVQYANALLPVIKDNADVAIVFRQMSNRQKRALWLDYGDSLNEWEFDNMMRTHTGIDASTEDRDVLVVDTTSMADDVIQTFYQYQVHKIPDEQIQPLGHVVYWQAALKKAVKEAEKLRQKASSSNLQVEAGSSLNAAVMNPRIGNSVWDALRQGNSYR